MNSMEEPRYERNKNAFSPGELELIRSRSVCVIGCGGLGGFAAAALARFGVGSLTVVDGDVFAPSNLNRQMFADETTLGQNKALACKNALAHINGDVAVTARAEMLDERNAADILGGHDLIMDCLDNPEARLLLGRHAAILGIPVIHAAVNGFWGQVSAVLPGDDTLQTLYSNWTEEKKQAQTYWGNPVFAVQAVSAVQCSEALKLLARRDMPRKKSLICIDLLSNSIETVDLS